MALVVIGGQEKDVGKTTLVCEIIRHFVAARWTAAKITSHLHEPEDCRPAASGSGWSICEQRSNGSNSDTARYLKAGAVRALLVRSDPGGLEQACSALKREISASANLIVESTAAVPLLAPNLFLLLINPESEDFKASAAKQLARADALVMSAEAKITKRRRYSGDVPIFQSFQKGLDRGLAKILEKLCDSERA